MGLNFQQGMLLWLLPLAALPIIIHLLNRLRYRSVQWAAMLFLLKATRSSTRRAKLRQILIMTFRVLVLLLFILALGRPKSGWGGWAFAGAPDTVIILLDRSASMEMEDPGSGTTRRELALKLISGAAEGYAGESKLVLIENVLRKPRSIQRAGQLHNFNLTTATDTAANIPAMMQAALDYMVETKTGRTEIWIASDLQESNWHPASPRWASLSSSMSALPQHVSVRVLSTAGDTPKNKALTFIEATRQGHSEDTRLVIDMSVTRDANAAESLPLTMHLNDGRVQKYIELEGQTSAFNQVLPLEDDSTSGWGYVHLPDDYNNHDNEIFFTYRRRQHQGSFILANNSTVARYMALAAAPAPKLLDQSATEVSPSMMAGMNTDEAAMLIWQAPIPSDKEEQSQLLDFIAEGGSVLCLPPGNPGTATLLGLRWGDTDVAPAGQPFTIERWDEREGPLANSSDGTPLELRNLAIKKRQAILDESVDTDAASYELAHFEADRKPFLAMRSHGKGRLYFLSSLPLRDWSSLSDGRVLVPMVQRMLYQGGERLSNTSVANSGEWDPGDENWVPLGKNEQKNPRWQAGVFQNGNQLVALNRPPEEDARETLSQERMMPLFGKVDVYSFSADPTDAKELEHEIWRLFLIAALLCMVTEGILITPPKPTTQAGRTS